MSKADDDRVLVIERVFDAPRSLVWEAWADGERARQWIAPSGMEVSVWESDARPGGTWRLVMGPASGPQHQAGGVYREVVPGEKIVFTHAWDEGGRRGHETVVTVTFSDEGRKTRMKFQQAIFASVEDRDGHREGWSESFDKLERVVKGMQ